VTSESTPVTLYWRPGCPYCWRLRTTLKRAGVPVDEINIWEDPAGAAFVRSVTGGDETVPTVRIGTRSLVNPSPRHLLEMIRESSG
jgi:mycoredoxin